MTQAEAERVAVDLVESWLVDSLDADVKRFPRETHRWLFCWDGTGDGTDDCACCGMLREEWEQCGCICHRRVGSLASAIAPALLTAVKAERERCAEMVGNPALLASDLYAADMPVDPNGRVVLSTGVLKILSAIAERLAKEPTP